MSASSFLHVLAVLSDDEAEAEAVLERAVELAEVEHACLTLAKTTDPGRAMRWFGSLGVLCRPPVFLDFDLQAAAARRVAALAAGVPGSIPLRTIVLGQDTPGALRQLLGGGSYDLVVAGATGLARSFSLRRLLSRAQVSVLAVNPDRLVSEGLPVEPAARVGGVVPA